MHMSSGRRGSINIFDSSSTHLFAVQKWDFLDLSPLEFYFSLGLSLFHSHSGLEQGVSRGPFPLFLSRKLFAASASAIPAPKHKPAQSATALGSVAVHGGGRGDRGWGHGYSSPLSRGALSSLLR